MEKQRRKLFALVEAMNEALDKQRWRRLPALHQQLIRQFHDYAAAETDAAQLDAVKARLYDAFNALIKRREQRAEVLKARMEQHQRIRKAYWPTQLFNLLRRSHESTLLATLGTACGNRFVEGGYFTAGER
ncbi:lateral flagellar chaperone protein (FliT-like) [Escherichia coli]|nr:lateral flagellar chaperone protein (FliT-like) [Escherichia coli]